jgi:predicted MFS family arabinose efflux permease
MRDYLIVTLAYWGFTLSDGALRMLVLFHFFLLGYSPFALAMLFLLYELAGVFANLGGGWLATRFGVKRMLIAGLSLQIVGFLGLSMLSPDWAAATAVAWVVVAQGICGVAKDLTKTASKSAIKLTEAEARGAREGRLYRWVAWFTGSKNAMKGFGFFLGGALLTAVGFQAALWIMAAALALVLLAVVVSLAPMIGKAQPSRSAREFFAKSEGVNLLAAARVALFGARDVFLYANGWSFTAVGAFLAAWTILYGGVQAAAPALTGRSADGLSREVADARLWGLLLLLTPVGIAGVLWAQLPQADVAVALGLLAFGFAFAVTSSLHSYLVLAYAGSKKAAEDVGFYYAANAAGRFMGTALSGALYQWGGLEACLAAAAALLFLSFAVSLRFPAAAHLTPSHPHN